MKTHSFGIRLPWNNLGCLGFWWRGVYRDIRIERDFIHVDGGIRMFKNDGKSQQWFKLVPTGRWTAKWQLTRYEGELGSWFGGKHRPPCYEYPKSISDRAWELRAKWQPYQIIDWFGRKMEIMSYPFPQRTHVGLMLREVDEQGNGIPDTLGEIMLERYYGTPQE